MAAPSISEFSYGYAITDELIHGQGMPITAAPVFPSLYQEGQTGGGYDVMIKGPAVPLFLQFKLTDCLGKRNAAEAKQLGVPYYRMHFRRTSYSNQHKLLIELESKGNSVYYCAPAFHLEQELNQAYLGGKVCKNSVWIKPSDVGPLPDSESHYAAFKDSSATQFLFCSSPKLVVTDISFNSVAEKLQQEIRENETPEIYKKRFEQLSGQLYGLAADYDLLTNAVIEYFTDLAPIGRASLLARVVLNSQLFLATLSDS